MSLVNITHNEVDPPGNRREKGGYVRTEEVLQAIPVGSWHPVKRSELAYAMNLTDREMRGILHEAKKKMPIINLQDGKGYFIPDMNLTEDRKLLAIWTKQELNRSKETIECIKPAVKTLANCGIFVPIPEEIRIFGWSDAW